MKLDPFHFSMFHSFSSYDIPKSLYAKGERFSGSTIKSDTYTESWQKDDSWEERLPILKYRATKFI